MNHYDQETTSRTVVGMFSRRDTAEAAIRDLKAAEFTEEQIGLAMQDAEPGAPAAEGRRDRSAERRGARRADGVAGLAVDSGARTGRDRRRPGLDARRRGDRRGDRRAHRRARFARRIRRGRAPFRRGLAGRRDSGDGRRRIQDRGSARDPGAPRHGSGSVAHPPRSKRPSGACRRIPRTEGPSGGSSARSDSPAEPRESHRCRTTRRRRGHATGGRARAVAGCRPGASPGGGRRRQLHRHLPPQGSLQAAIPVDAGPRGRGDRGAGRSRRHRRPARRSRRLRRRPWARTRSSRSPRPIGWCRFRRA